VQCLLLWKRQSGWQSSLSRFVRGGGVAFDMEFLTTPEGSRLTQFGSSAGFIGMASGLMAWCRQVLSAPGISVSLVTSRHCGDVHVAAPSGQNGRHTD
jgi:hypothetical protein